jgi:hypothetical protein
LAGVAPAITALSWRAVVKRLAAADGQAMTTIAPNQSPMVQNLAAEVINCYERARLARFRTTMDAPTPCRTISATDGPLF